jgi:hypothetical protein
MPTTRRARKFASNGSTPSDPADLGATSGGASKDPDRVHVTNADNTSNMSNISDIDGSEFDEPDENETLETLQQPPESPSKPRHGVLYAAGGGGYNALKTFNGQVYSGMAVGGSHTWNYDQGVWKETKEEPDLWKVDYRTTKRRARNAPKGSGAPIGTEYHWLIVAHQVRFYF